MDRSGKVPAVMRTRPVIDPNNALTRNMSISNHLERRCGQGCWLLVLPGVDDLRECV